MTDKLYPYDDDLMIFDDARQMYFLTERALVENGIDIRARIGASAPDPSFVIGGVLRAVSGMVYREIHRFNRNTHRQDAMIATVPELRPIIYNVLLNQAQYYVRNGDLTKSADPALRNMAMYAGFDEDVAVVVPCGLSLIYAG